MTQDVWSSVLALLPVITLVGWATLLLLLDVFLPAGRKGITSVLAALGLVVSLVLVALQFGANQQGFGGMVAVDSFASFMNALLLLSGLAGVALAYDYLKRIGINDGEYYVLLLFAIAGMMLMSMSSDLIMVFLSLELLSIPLYILAGIATPRPASEEAAIKYFLLGSFASGFLLFGTALVYGATATTNLSGIAAALQASGGVSEQPVLMLAGAALILIGLGFKVAVAPFHMWTPDVYHGAPSAVTAFMSVGAKAAGFAALLRIFVLTLPALSEDLTPVLWVLAALTMTLGNIAAIAQKNIKRLLAYSSIAHAGYILMALAPYGVEDVAAESTASALFYLAAYALTNFAAWAVVIALEGAENKGLELADYAGLGRKYPALAAVMLVAMLSFTGVPPTLGFMGKFYLFRTVIEGGFYWLAIIGVLTSLISAYYYLRVVIIMYMQDGEPVAQRETWLYATAFISAAAVVVLSLFSAPLLNLASQAVLKLF
jgi:NADH-quinone oxidoreductase subunit N